MTSQAKELSSPPFRSDFPTGAALSIPVTRPTSSIKPIRPARDAAKILFVILSAQMMAVIDLTIVNIAAPTIQADLHTSGSGLQLVLAGYVISYAMTLITGARLGDRFGHARVFDVGLIVFTLASLLCGVAGTSTQLVIFRLIQGLGAGAMMPQVMSLIQRTFQGPARLRAQGFYSAVIALGAVIGQVVGGALVSADLFGSSWRPIFLLNVPIGAALIIFAKRWLSADRGEVGRTLDLAGVFTLSAAVLAIVVPLVLGHQQHWPLWGWLTLTSGVGLLGIFAAVERRVDRRGGSPLVSGRLVRTPGLVAGGVTVMLTMLSFGGFLLTLTLHLQGVLGITPLTAGLLFAPAAIGSTISSLNWQRLPSRLRRVIVPVGLLGLAATYLLLAPIEVGGHRNTGLLIPDLFVLGLFFGAAYSPIISLTLANVPRVDAADASGVLVTLLQLGQVLGVATLGTLYLSLLGHPAPAHAAAITFAAVAGSAVLASISGAILIRRRP